MKVMMVTIGFPPDDVGGTEMYVLGLIESLKKLNCECEVVYMVPRSQESCEDVQWSYRSYQQIPIHVMEVNQEVYPLHAIFSEPGKIQRLVSEMAEGILKRHPDIVHFHPLQLNLDARMVPLIRSKGIPIFLTFHSSTTTCMRGDLVRKGREVCDGEVIHSRCLSCYYHSKGVPESVADLLGNLPQALHQALYQHLPSRGLLSRVKSFFSFSNMLNDRSESWNRIIHSVSGLVAVCDWVRDCALKNGAPPTLVHLSRHGLRLQTMGAQRPSKGHKLTLGFLGRLSEEKGIDTLLEAWNRLPATLPIRLQISSSSLVRTHLRHGERRWVREIVEKSKEDPRLELLGCVEDERLPGVLSQWDALVVPSHWLESGPMVVYEAFSVQTPVIGSRRGGIAELVQHGVTGYLFQPDSSEELAELMIRFSHNPDLLHQLRLNVPAQRTFDDVASEMMNLYSASIKTL